MVVSLAATFGSDALEITESAPNLISESISPTVLVGLQPIAIVPVPAEGEMVPAEGEMHLHTVPDPNISVPSHPTTGSTSVLAGGLPVHRVGDLRACGAVTEVLELHNVFIGD